jgi:glucokinase
MFLAGDIGGTNSRLALFDERLRPLRTETFRTREQSSFRELVERFVRDARFDVQAACFGVAGAVGEDAVVGVNLPWRIDLGELRAAFPFPLQLVNDLVANARGIERLAATDFTVLNAGDEGAAGTRAVVSAGTGLGEAVLWWDGARHHVQASEGGHSDFAPRSPLEVELYARLAAEHGHVSYERVCSGAGLSEIFRFLGGSTGDELADPALISAQAAVSPNGLAARALNLFASIYGARAGNVALSTMATGGVYLGGGIAPRIAARLRRGPFMAAFTDKGRMSPLLRRIPVRIVLNDRAALLGAAQIAAELRPGRRLAVVA